MNPCLKKIDKVHTVWQLREKNNLDHEPLKGLSVHFIDLERFRKSSPDLAEKLNQWLAFVDTENQEWVNFVMENNKKIEEASKLKEDFTADGVTQEMLELYEKWDMDERTLKKEAREAGMAEGLAEGLAEGREKGLAEGRAEGEKIGIEKGKKENQREMVKAMHRKHIDISTITEITSLSKDEVEKIINS